MRKLCLFVVLILALIAEGRFVASTPNLHRQVVAEQTGYTKLKTLGSRFDGVLEELKDWPKELLQKLDQRQDLLDDFINRAKTRPDKLKEEVARLRERVNGAGKLIDDALIAEMRAAGVKFTEANLKFVAKNNDNLTMFLEKGNPSSGLQHIIDGKWTGKPSFQELFNNNIDEMVENMFKAVKESNYIQKTIDSQNRLSYVYKVQTTQGLREFKVATGSNGYIVSFIPNWP